jgi:hypothetical protein
LSSADTRVMWWLLKLEWSSFTLWQAFSTLSAGQPTTWLIKDSRYRRDKEGVIKGGPNGCWCLFPCPPPSRGLWQGVLTTDVAEFPE